MGVVRRYIDFLIILLIPTPLVLALFLQQHPPTSLFIFKMFFRSYNLICVNDTLIILCANMCTYVRMRSMHCIT